MGARVAKLTLMFGAAVVLLAPSLARAQDGGQPGECASGYCGTPKNNGGGGCGCGGGSILVNNTDIGDTYSTSDDYDGDGIEDDFDNCPYIANRDQADSDGDKIGDVCDNCTAVANPDQHDVNANGVGDACDPDIDGDGKPNAVDNCPYVPNKDQGDINGNGVGDLCDPDMDGDQVLNAVDNCPRIYNPDQSKTIPGQHGNACDFDADKDMIDDSKDNCPAVFNTDQTDTNKNGIGDACDPDMDGDGVVNQYDNCPLVPNAPDAKGVQADADKDGVGDACQTHGFCFVAGKNRVAHCLDPKNVFRVTAAVGNGPIPRIATGVSVFLSLYSNRENVGIKYSYAVTMKPEGADDLVKHPRGSTTVSDAFEYHYVSDGEKPTFMATVPGTYRINLAADLMQPDPLFPGVIHAENEVEFVAVGDSVATSGGCSVPSRRSTGTGAGVLLFGLIAVGGLVARRRNSR